MLLISIHAPRMGSDNPVDGRLGVRTLFQSTLPGWGATHLVGYLRFLLYISIHAPRMGSDTGVYRVTPVRWTYFNPRSPDGERQNSKRYNIMQKNFNPRSPDGERPHSDHRILLARDNFNPRSPDGERHAARKSRCNARLFQSTLPGWGATLGNVGRNCSLKLFQSTLPGWGATAKMDIFAHDMGKIIHFQH